MSEMIPMGTQVGSWHAHFADEDVDIQNNCVIQGHWES